MSIALGAWLAAASGLIAGWIAAFIRHHPPSRGAVIASILLGALFAALAYGAFLAAGFIVSMLLFSGPPDPAPALLCAVVGCAGFLLLTWLQLVLGRHVQGGESRMRGFPGLLDARPAGGRAKMWLAGVGIALLPAIYGVQCLWTRKGTLGTLIWSSAVEGGPAMALGLGWIGVGAFLHFHFFFGLHPRLGVHSRTGKFVALIAACAGHCTAGAWAVLAKAMG